MHLQEQVENLGPVVGPLIFTLTMAAAEMIPLFPTQPLSLASGLLFGPVQVAKAGLHVFCHPCAVLGGHKPLLRL